MISGISDEAAKQLPGGVVETLVDVRYLGQSHEVTVPYAAGEGWHILAERFHVLHRERNGFARPGDPIEVVTIRATATGSPAIESDVAFSWSPVGEGLIGTRAATAETGAVEAAVWNRAALAVGAGIGGPAVIEESEATTWIGPGERAVVTPTGALEVTW